MPPSGDDWTLFLDRDGVINRRQVGGYLKGWHQFEFIDAADQAIVQLSRHYRRIVVVTNQQGISKGIVSTFEMDHLHYRLQHHIAQMGGIIHRVYYCPEHRMYHPLCRKPNVGMPLQAQRDDPSIDFARSVMVGDFSSDIEMGHRLGMTTVFIDNDTSEWLSETQPPHFTYPSLWAFCQAVQH